jgi:hypothetical protein
MSWRCNDDIQRGTAARSQVMSKQSLPPKSRAHLLDRTDTAAGRMRAYWAAHPRSPSAVRRPRLLLRGQLWIALLGPSMADGIVGIGPTVEAALRAFDSQYLASLRPPRRSKRCSPALTERIDCSGCF